MTQADPVPSRFEGGQRYRGASVVVTGAGGFVGAQVAGALAALGAVVHQVVRPGGSDADPRYGPIHALDLSAVGGIEALIFELAPTAVFNLAGYGVRAGQRDEALAQALNAHLPGRLASALLEVPGPIWAGPRLIHAGSALEYGRVSGDLDEAGPCRPDSLYGLTKLAGAEAAFDAARRGLPAVVARLFNVYGPGEQPEKLLPTLMARAGGGGPIPLTLGEQRRDFLHVRDAVEALLRLGCAEAARGAVVNVATGVLTPVRVFVQLAAAALGIPAERLDFGALPIAASEMAHLPVSVSRLMALTGWRPGILPEEGVRQTVAAAGAGGAADG